MMNIYTSHILFQLFRSVKNILFENKEKNTLTGDHGLKPPSLHQEFSAFLNLTNSHLTFGPDLFTKNYIPTAEYLAVDFL